MQCHKRSILCLVDINPKGLVPAIEYGGRALYESLVLCEFLEEAFPQATPRLLPSDPADRAYARIWIDFIAKSIVPTFFRLLQAQKAEKQQEALQDSVKALKTFADKVKGPYFLGDEFSLVDVAIAPWVVREYIIEEHRGYTRDLVGDGWKAYAELLEKRDSVLRTQSVRRSILYKRQVDADGPLQDREHYTEIYGRYLRDEAQSEAAKATRAGRVIP